MKRVLTASVNKCEIILTIGHTGKEVKEATLSLQLLISLLLSGESWPCTQLRAPNKTFILFTAPVQNAYTSLKSKD